ncbi:MAG: hypothetical protein GC200_08955 [Tepidisphaera sp.]|nr:hypothetical protein [Tepidisphaera sp.]
MSSGVDVSGRPIDWWGGCIFGAWGTRASRRGGSEGDGEEGSEAGGTRASRGAGGSGSAASMRSDGMRWVAPGGLRNFARRRMRAAALRAFSRWRRGSGARGADSCPCSSARWWLMMVLSSLTTLGR